MTETFHMPHQDASHSHRRQPALLTFFAMILFTGFAIPVSIVAIDAFWPGGILLAAFMAYQWGAIMGLNQGTPVNEAVEMLRPRKEPNAPKSSGNTSFDAYRAELLERLETEQTQFDNFLVRLRDAKDKTEFDSFMEDRAKAARLADDS
ncbi:MAG: DUF2852 domain-containing protein [Pseudomonadota bacterium]